MPATQAERLALRRSCTLVVPDFASRSAAEEFREIAAWCEAGQVEHDMYGQGALVEGFERKVAAMLGKEAAMFAPSGVLAQLAAVRIWTEAAGVARFGMHPTSHLAHHEEQAYAALLHCHGVPVGDRLRPMRAADLEAVRESLACLLVELPIREAGGQLPSWDELEALKAAARERRVPLHMDGARLWESAAYYGKDHAAIAAGFDSVYVSVYKGIGGFAGALLAGDSGFVAKARVWRRRLGGTLHHLSPLVASAAIRFDERIALMPALYRRAVELASGLADLPGLRVNPAVPQTNMMHLYFDAPAEAVADARDALAKASGCWLVNAVRPAEVPGWSVTELYVGDQLLGADNARVVGLFARLCEAIATSRPGR
ncbi:MAG: threonine aldolase [Burkholderiales bacterium]|nr:threonine aldolase [Burkholderiales bacterium]